MAKEFLRKIQFFLLMALAAYPVCACIVIFIAPELLPYMWLLSAAFGVFGCLSLCIPRKLRLALGIIGCCVFVLPGVILLGGNARNIMLLFGAGYGGLLLWSLQIAGWNPDQEIGFGWLGGGVTVLLLGCLLAYYEPRLATVALGIRISLFVFVFLAMYSLNRGSLQMASGGKGSISGRMRRKNALLILAMFALAMLIALIPSIMHLFEMLFTGVGNLLTKIKEQFPDRPMAEATTPPSSEEIATGEGMDALKEQAPSYRTSAATYVIMAVIALGIMTPVAGYALYKLGVVLWQAAQRIVSRIVDGANVVAEEFEDEVSDTRKEDLETGHEFATKAKQTIRFNFTPAERIRNHYRSLQMKNPKWLQSSTARENLPEEAARLYEKARYSTHPITRQDAEEFKNRTK